MRANVQVVLTIPCRRRHHGHGLDIHRLEVVIHMQRGRYMRVIVQEVDVHDTFPR